MTQRPTLILPCDGTKELPVQLDQLAPRSITIGLVTYSVTQAVYERLAAAGLVYDCTDGHDLHLMPDGPGDEGWNHDAVIALAAILLGGTAPEAGPVVVKTPVNASDCAFAGHGGGI